MTRDEMINFIKEHPNVKITHVLFDKDEYIYSKNDGNVYDENDYLFEDWSSCGPSCSDGIRIREGGIWEDGWKIKPVTKKEYYVIQNDDDKFFKVDNLSGGSCFVDDFEFCEKYNSREFAEKFLNSRCASKVFHDKYKNCSVKKVVMTLE